MSIAYYLLRYAMKKISALIILILFTTFSCSRIDLAVSLANSFITTKTDDFFDLTWEQKSWLKEVLIADISKIKKTIFPQLALEMLKIANLLNNQQKFDSSMVLRSYNHLEKLYYDGLKVFAPTAVAFVDKLRTVQIDYFQKQVDKKFIEMKDDPEDKSYKKMKKNFDSWMGGMTSAQKKELKEFLTKNPSPVKEIVYHRQHLVHEFIRTYPDKLTRKSYVEKLFTNYESEMDPKYKKIIEEKNIKVATFFANILNKISNDQKQIFIDIIRDRANQIIKISKS